jgi:hypothetical protein
MDKGEEVETRKKASILPAHTCVAIWNGSMEVTFPRVPVAIGTEGNRDVDIIEEEVNELLTAIRNNDLQEMCDGFADSLWTITQAAMRRGLNINDLMRCVFISNMSKFCKTEEEAIATCKAYSDGTHPDKLGISINCYYQKKGDLYIIYRYDDDKVLKSVNFIQPDFSFMLNRSKK